MGDWHAIDYCIEQLQEKYDEPFSCLFAVASPASSPVFARVPDAAGF